MQIRSFQDPSLQAQALAERVASILKEAIAQRGTASLALSGGQTPVSFFKHLARMDLPWSKVLVTLVDERWVSPEDPESNEHLVRKHFLQAKAKAARFLGLKTKAPSPEEGLEESQKRLSSLSLPLDVVVLGMGEDGHTASLFPKSQGLKEALSSSSLLAAITPGKAPHQRITLTLSVLLGARHLFLLLLGEEKLATLKKALREGPAEEMPIRFFLRQRPIEIYWAP